MDVNSIRVAFLGPFGTFSEEATLEYFGSSTVLEPTKTIDEAFLLAETNKVDYTVVPVENSIEGGVNRTLDLLSQTSLIINGEISIRIVQNLVTLAKNLNDITEVFAHPQSLAQCYNWLEANLPSAIKTPITSNAEAVLLASKNDKLAAVAGKIAIKKYNMKALATAIEDMENNSTRFLILSKNTTTKQTGFDKTSIILEANANKAGSLYELLGILEKYNISMIRLESRPKKQKIGEYFFHIDLEGHFEDNNVKNALLELKEKAHSLKFLGSYANPLK